MSLREKAIKGVLWSGIQNWGSSLVTIAVFLVLVRLLGPDDFGLVALANVFIAFLTIFQREGFAQAIVQRTDLEAGHLDTALWTGSVVALLLGGSMFLGADLVAAALGQASLGPVLRVLSVIVPINALRNTPEAILRRNLAFKSLAIRSLAGAVVGGAVGVAMALSGYGVWSLVGQRVADSVVGTAAIWVASRWRPGLNVSMAHFRDLFGFGVYTLGRGVLQFLNRRTDDLLIGTFLGAAALGYYSAGRRLLLIMSRLFTQTVAAVALPTFSRLQHDHAQMRQSLLTATRMAGLLAFPAFLGAALLAPEIVRTLFGEGWDRSIPIMQLLALVGIIRCMTFFNGPVIIACGKPSWAFSFALGSALTAVAVYGVTVQWGIVAVAVGHLIHRCAVAPFPVWLVRKLIGLNPVTYLREYLAPAAASLIMIAVVAAAKHFLAAAGNHVILAIAVLIGVVVYAGVMRLIAPDRLRQAVEYIRLAFGASSSRDAE
jgi:PST family polysaccharide transporter